MSDKLLLVPVLTRKKWTVDCQRCGKVITSGIIMLVLVENEEILGIIAGEVVRHCGVVHGVPLFFDDVDGAKVFRDVLLAGLDEYYANKLEILGKDSIHPNDRTAILTMVKTASQG